VKVLDFGLVKSFLPDKAIEGADITQAGVFLGSPQYMAPEQARNLADPRSDIYSLGVVLYQMLMGRPPFYAEQSIDVIVKHMKEPPQPFGAARPELDIPAEVEALVMKCLSKRPDDRYQSMDELLEGIRSAALGTGISGAFSGLKTPPPMNQSGSHRMTQSGPHAKSNSGSGAYVKPTQSGVRAQPNTSAPHRSGSGAFKQPGSGAHRAPVFRSQAIDISVDAEAGTDADVPTVSARRAKPLFLVIGGIALGLLGAVGYVVLRPAPKPVAPVTEAPSRVPTVAEPAPKVAPVGDAKPDPSPEVRPPAPENVWVRVTSVPSGAHVMFGSQVLGNTPYEFPIPAGPKGLVEASLTLTLEGYLPVTVNAVGTGPRVDVEGKLTRKPVAIPPPPGPGAKPPRKPNGYKDDPY